MLWIKSVWLISFFLLPFFQGGYFYFEKISFACIQLVVFFILSVKGKLKVSFYGYRKLVYLYMLLVFVSPLVAIDKGMQIFNILSMLGVLIFAINMDALITKVKDVILVYLMALWIMALITLIGVFLTGSDGALFDYLLQGSRVGGLFQYANAFGIFYFLGIVYCTSQDHTMELQWFYRLSSFMFTLILVLTGSRMVLVIAIVYYFFLFILNMRLWKQYVFGFIGGISGYLLLQALYRVIRKTGELVASREIDLSASEWQSRLLYYEDGLRMLFKNPLGSGHLGYFYSQSFYQTGAAYNVKHIHSSLLQSSLDYGFIAGIVILALGMYSLIVVIRKFLETYKNKQISHNLFKFHQQKVFWMIGMSGVFLHTCFDFDLQFMSIWLLFLVGLRYMEELIEAETKEKKNPLMLLRNPKLQGLVASIAIILIGVTVYWGGLSFAEYEDQDIRVLQEYPNYTEAITDLIRHRAFDDEMSVGKFKEIVIDKVESNSYYSEGFAFLREYYYNNGDLVSSLEQSDEVIRLKPLWEENFIIHAQITLSYLRQGLNNETLQKEDPRLLWLMNIESYMKELEKTKSNHYELKHKVNFIVPDEVVNYVDEAVNIYMQLKANGE